jgi:hypothetical protein
VRPGHYSSLPPLFLLSLPLLFFLVNLWRQTKGKRAPRTTASLALVLPPALVTGLASTTTRSTRLGNLTPRA